MRCQVAVQNRRNILCVFPQYTPAFGTFQHAYKLMYRVKAFMPPQGLLLIAAYMPENWPVRFVDENIAFFARLHGVSDFKARRSRLLELTRLLPFRDRLADRLSDLFETRVKVEVGKHKGKIVIEFASPDDLERIVKAMSPDQREQEPSE